MTLEQATCIVYELAGKSMAVEEDNPKDYARQKLARKLVLEQIYSFHYGD